MAFTVISVVPGLSSKQHGRAVASGPEFVETDTDYPDLLAQTGWVVTDYKDITEAYGVTCRRQLDADEAQKEELKLLIGASAYADRVDGWLSKLVALDEKLLRREIFTAMPA